MENDSIAVVILSTGSHHEINLQTYEQISQAVDHDILELPNKTRFKKSGIMEITGIEDFKRQHPKEYANTHAPQENLGLSWEEIKALPANGYAGIIRDAKDITNLKTAAEGLKKFIEQRQAQGLTTKNSMLILASIRRRAKQIKSGLSVDAAKETYQPRYNHIYAEDGRTIIKYAWEVQKEAEARELAELNQMA